MQETNGCFADCTRDIIGSKFVNTLKPQQNGRPVYFHDRKVPFGNKSVYGNGAVSQQAIIWTN